MMTLPVETLKEISDMARKAATPVECQVSQHEKKLFFADGREERITTEPPYRNHYVESLDDFVDACQHFCVSDQSSSVWHDLTEVILVIDDATRRDRVTLPLRFSEPFQLLRDGFARKQRDLLTVLKCTLTDVVHEAEITTLKGSKPPEFVTFRCRVYCTPGVDREVEIRTSLDIDVDTEMIRITPLDGQIDAAIERTQERIATDLADAFGEMDPPIESPIFWGSP